MWPLACLLCEVVHWTPSAWQLMFQVFVISDCIPPVHVNPLYPAHGGLWEVFVNMMYDKAVLSGTSALTSLRSNAVPMAATPGSFP